MTQLFDISHYDEDDQASRHLRSIETGPVDQTVRPTAWRLDDETIEIGRRGIARARQALRETGRADEPTSRRAA